MKYTTDFTGDWKDIQENVLLMSWDIAMLSGHDNEVIFDGFVVVLKESLDHNSSWSHPGFSHKNKNPKSCFLLYCGGGKNPGRQVAHPYIIFSYYQSKNNARKYCTEAHLGHLFYLLGQLSRAENFLFGVRVTAIHRSDLY